MNTRFLFIFSLVVTVLAVWFYRNQGELDSVINLSETNIEYQATDILAVQTNDNGVAEYSLIADDLTHYAKENSDELTNMKLNWRPVENNDDSYRDIVVSADKAIMHHETSKVVMSDNVFFISHTQRNNELMDGSPIKINAQEIIGNLDKKQVYSTTPIKVTQNKNSFEAANFTADMTTGDYQFSKVAVTFNPPIRNDVPLF